MAKEAAAVAYRARAVASPHSVYSTPLAWKDLLGLLLSARIYVTVASFWLNLANPFTGSSPFFARSCHEDEASVYRPAPVAIALKTPPERHAPIAGIYDIALAPLNACLAGVSAQFHLLFVGVVYRIFGMESCHGWTSHLPPPPPLATPPPAPPPRRPPHPFCTATLSYVLPATAP